MEAETRGEEGGAPPASGLLCCPRPHNPPQYPPPRPRHSARSRSHSPRALLGAGCWAARPPPAVYLPQHQVYHDLRETLIKQKICQNQPEMEFLTICLKNLCHKIVKTFLRT